VAFWWGRYIQAVGWGVRALRSTLALRVLPYVVRLFATQALPRGESHRRHIGPGTAFSDWDMPPPMIPYDRFYRS
jgi:hypothetical protein